MYGQTQASYIHSAWALQVHLLRLSMGIGGKNKNARKSQISFLKNPSNIRANFQAGAESDRPDAERLVAEWLKGWIDSASKAYNQSRPIRNIQVLRKQVISFLPHGWKDGGWNEY